MTAKTPEELADIYYTLRSTGHVSSEQAFQRMIEARFIVSVDLEEKHQVEFTENGWVMQHPLLDRLMGTLFSCDYNKVADEQYRDGPPERVIEAGPSRWRVELSADGEVLHLLDRLA